MDAAAPKNKVEVAPSTRSSYSLEESMKSIFQFATNVPLALALVVITLCITAILTQYPGSINIDWSMKGGILKIDGSPQLNKLDAQKTE